MKLPRSLSVWLLSLCLLPLLCSCAGPDPAQELARAREKLAQVGSMTCEVVMDMRMSVQDTPVSMETTCLAECVSDPLTLKMDLSTDIIAPGIDAGELDGLDYTVYAAQNGDSFTMYTQVLGGWVKEELDGPGELEQYDLLSSMDTYLSSFAGVTQAGSEQINGVKAARYDCVVGSDAVDGIIGASGVYSQLAPLGISEERARQALSGLGEMSYSIWIDAESSLPVRCEIDMSGIMGALVEKIFGAAGEDSSGVCLDSLIITMTMGGFDTIASIDIPAGALDAMDITGMGFPLF